MLVNVEVEHKLTFLKKQEVTTSIYKYKHIPPVQPEVALFIIFY